MSSETKIGHDREFWGDEKIIHGRPDFGDSKFGHTRAKKVPKYAYSPRRGCLVHKVLRIEMRWWDVGGDGEYLIRRDSPRMTIFTSCGQMMFLSKGRSTTCAIPEPNAVLCGRCHGEGPIFGKNSKHKVTKREASARLGCIALTE